MKEDPEQALQRVKLLDENSLKVDLQVEMEADES